MLLNFINKISCCCSNNRNKTVTTGTTTVWLPPVGIYISDGQTSTSTITDAQWNTYPVTFTSIINKDQAAPTQQTTEAQQQQPTTTTTSSTSPAQPTTTETQQQQQQQPTTTEQAQPTTTEQQPQQPTTTEQQQQQQPTTTEQAQPTTTSTEQAPQSTEQGQQQGQPTTTEQTSQTTEQGQQTTEQNDTTTQSPSTTTIDYTSSTSSTSTSSPNPSSSIGSSGDIPAPTAIVYSPYANDRSCKSADTIRSDIQLINSKGIKQIRSYGTDCGSLTTVLETCRELGITVNQGFGYLLLVLILLMTKFLMSLSMDNPMVGMFSIYSLLVMKLLLLDTFHLQNWSVK